MEKISAVMIVYNGEKYLSQVLESIQTIAEEIIVVIDSKTTDRTQEIAEKFQAKTFIKEWTGYAKQKNFAISCAKNNWILSVDSDEVLDKELIRNIQNQDFSKYDGFYIARKNFFGKKWVKHCGWYPDWQLRLFRKEMKFEEKEVHERVKEQGKISHLLGNLLHYTYNSEKDYFEKIKEYTNLDAKILYKKRRKWSLSYQIGKPLKEFWQMYFVEYGFLDGLTGLKICLYSTYYRYLTAKKLKELYAHSH